MEGECIFIPSVDKYSTCLETKRTNTRKRNTAIVNDIFDKDLKSLLINNWENPNILPLLLQIKNVQYLEEQHKKESGK